jgi:hypothetical protein
VPPREVYRQAARASWAAPIMAVVVLTLTASLRARIPIVALTLFVAVVVVFVGGLALGAFAVSGIRVHGREGIAGNAFVGVGLSGVMLVLSVMSVATRPPPSAPPATQSTQPTAATTQASAP